MATAKHALTVPNSQKRGSAKPRESAHQAAPGSNLNTP